MAWVALNSHSGSIQALGVIVDWTLRLGRSIAAHFEVQKHVEGQPHSITINGNNNSVVVINQLGTPFEMSPGDCEIFEKGSADAAAEKIVSPLRAGSVDTLTLQAGVGDGAAAATVDSTQKEHFMPPDKVANPDDGPEAMEGRFVSLNKESNRGMFEF